MLSNKEEVHNFDTALGVLVKQPLDVQMNMLPEIYLVFNDSCVHSEVMWGLLHYVESLGIEKYVPALVEATPNLLRNASDWSEKFYIRLLNSEKGRDLLKSILLSSPKDLLNAVDRILESITQKRIDDLTKKVDFVLSKK